jgi:hypothetical protein
LATIKRTSTAIGMLVDSAHLQTVREQQTSFNDLLITVD